MQSAAFPFLRSVSDPGGGHAPEYVVGAMMTPSHAAFGARLAASCRAHGLPLALYEVPSVHRSISVHGADDPRQTKANFVKFLLDRYQRAVLYLDVDCVVTDSPVALTRLLMEQQVDFAIFNWLAEEHTEAYVPADVAPPGRFYRFSHSIDHYSRTQLLCSGAVQWYANTAGARGLLDAWQTVVERAPGTADDKCLDFAFNNAAAGAAPVRAAWLDKRYARYAWWIYVRPVINHPEFPAPGCDFLPLHHLDDQPRIHTDKLTMPAVRPVFDRELLIDTHARTLLRLCAGTWRTVGSFSIPLWLEGADRGTP